MNRKNIKISPSQAFGQKLKVIPTIIGSVFLAILFISFFFGTDLTELEQLGVNDKMESFELELHESSVVLQWYGEIDSSLQSFQVERSQDNIHYESVGIVPVREGDYSEKMPSFKLIDRTIERLSFPLAYYRIREIRKDGKDKYRHPQKIELPFEGQIYASIDEINAESIHFKYASDFPSDLEYQIKDEANNVIISGKTWSDQETQILEVDVKEWDSGAYYLKFLHKKRSLTQPFIIP